MNGPELSRVPKSDFEILNALHLWILSQTTSQDLTPAMHRTPSDFCKQSLVDQLPNTKGLTNTSTFWKYVHCLF